GHGVGQPDAEPAAGTRGPADRRAPRALVADPGADRAGLAGALLYGRADGVAGLPAVGTLLRTYPAAKVGPISLLVPCVALSFAVWLVGEPVSGLRLVGIVVVLGGLAIGLLASIRRLR